MPDGQPASTAIPRASLVFGYGPMLPLVAGAFGVWMLPAPWPALALRLSLLWGALILAFVAGVRRGFGFGRTSASTRNEIGTMLVYFTLAGLALVLANFGQPLPALAFLLVGYVMVAILDARAAYSGNAPAYFARLRPSQIALAVLGLAALLIRLMLPLH